MPGTLCFRVEWQRSRRAIRTQFARDRSKEAELITIVAGAYRSTGYSLA
jgi:hypothetical protein